MVSYLPYHVIIYQKLLLCIVPVPVPVPVSVHPSLNVQKFQKLQFYTEYKTNHKL